MICFVFEEAEFVGHRLACGAEGWPPQVAGWVGLAAAGISLAWAIAGPAKPQHRLGAMMAALGCVLLAFAAGLPEARPEAPPAPGGRVAVVLDTSESVLRDGRPGYDEARQLVADRIASGSDRLDESDWRGRVFGFSGAAVPLSGEVPLQALPGAVVSADPGRPGEGSALSAGLAAALDWIAEGPGSGAIYLMSDGWATGLAPDESIARAVGRGVPVHVLGQGSTTATQGLLARDVGPEQALGRQAVARLVTLGEGRIDWSVNGRSGSPLTTPETLEPQPVRLPLDFEERGFAHVEVSFETDGAAPQHGTLYTLVRGPARVLVYGDAPWADALPPERYVIIRATPGDEAGPAGFDAVVIDGMVPTEFRAGFADSLLGAAIGGTGVFIENGPLRGSKEDEQAIAMWEQTSFGPVLPVNSDPETYLSEPPPRTVLIVIDTSGSMANSNAAGEQHGVRAVAAAKRVLEFLRPIDTLRVLPFSSGVGAEFFTVGATPSEKARAEAYLDRLRFGGGTNMQAAIQSAARLRGTSCDLFVIGDGGYPANMVRTSPICRTTAIGVAGIELPGFDTRWGEQKPLAPREQLGRIEFQTFVPEERTTFWREGPLPLRIVEEGAPFFIPTPIGGMALSYPRPEAQVELIPQDPPPDPALAFRRDPVRPSLNTAVFLGDMPATLPEPAADAIFDRLIGWSDPNRLDIRLEPRGEGLAVRIAAAAGASAPKQLTASILMPDGRRSALQLGAGREAGTWTGSGPVWLGPVPVRALFVLDAGGGDVQFIPIHLPARRDGAEASAPGSESEAIGVRYDGLQTIATQTGGVDLERSVPMMTAGLVGRPALGLWPFLAALGFAFYTAGLWFGGARR